MATTIDTAISTINATVAANNAAAAAAVLAATQAAAPKTPAPGDSNWTSYWQSKDPQAWTLVWDSQVPKNRTFYENLKTGTPVYFSFDIADSKAEYSKYLVSMTEEQKTNTRLALQELSNVTGVQFVERSGVKGGLVLGLADLSSGGDKYSTMGEHQGAVLDVKDSNGTVTKQYQQTIMVNKWEYTGKSLAPGTSGFETMLHELGHAAGLDDAKEELKQKYPQYNDTQYTLMSYEDAKEKNRSKYAELDRRAFEILYPTDRRPATPPTVVSPDTRLALMATATGYDEEDDLALGELSEADWLKAEEAMGGDETRLSSEETQLASEGSLGASTGTDVTSGGEQTPFTETQLATGQDQETVTVVEEEAAAAKINLAARAAFDQGQAWLAVTSAALAGGFDPVALQTCMAAAGVGTPGLPVGPAADSEPLWRILAQA